MANVQEAQKMIAEYIDAHQDEMVAFLREFVAIESQTYDEGEAINWLAKKMEEAGFDEVRIDPVGNCHGRVGSGDTVLLYDAHIDTVELGEACDWGCSPLEGKHDEDDYVWGRGVIDDKGALAAMFWGARGLKALGLDKDFTMWVSGSISEEDVEGSCVEEMLKIAPDIKPDYIVVAEPSENRLIRGHKGRALLKITVPGKCAHASAAHRGENALIKALPIIQGVDAMNDFEEDPFMGKGTIEVTKVECKTPSLNTIPGECTIYVDRRIARGESREELLAEIQPLLDQVPGATAVIDDEEVITYTGYKILAEDYFPSWEMPVEHELIQAGIRAYQEVYNEEPVVGSWDFCTNATTLCGKTGIPAIGFGPGDGGLCHSSEERILVSDYVNAAKLYALLAITASDK